MKYKKLLLILGGIAIIAGGLFWNTHKVTQPTQPIESTQTSESLLGGTCMLLSLGGTNQCTTPHANMVQFINNLGTAFSSSQDFTWDNTTSPKILMIGSGSDQTRVGINMRNPVETLQVNGAIKFSNSAINVDTPSAGALAFQDGGHGYGETFRFISWGANAITKGAYSYEGYTADGTNSTYMFINSSGNVGINNTNPTTRLDITGSASISTNFEVSGYASLSNNLFVQNNGNVGIGNTTPNAKLDVTGNILASTSGNVDLTLNNTAQAYGKFILRSMASPVAGRLDIIGGAAGATTLVSIASSGNVGIGTTGPSQKLEVNGSVKIDNGNNLIIGDSSNANGILLGNSGNDFVINQVNNSNIIFKTTNTERVRINNTGNVGIGTTAPKERLSITGTSSSSYGFFNNTINVAGTSSVSYNRFGNVATTHALSATNDVLINGKLEVDSNIFLDGGASISAGNFEVSGTGYASASYFYAQPGTALLPAFSFGNDTNTGMFDKAADSLSFSTGGIERLNLTATTASISNTIYTTGGNVGIGTSVPGSRLSIFGGSLTATADSALNIASGLPTGRAGTYDAGSLSAIHTFFDNTTVELSAGSTSGWVSGISVTGNNATLLRGTVRMMTASVERMRIDSSGNVGIGETGPEEKLSVAGNILASSSGNVDLTLNSTTNQDDKFTLRSVGSATNARLSILGSASQEFVTVASSGNVGIGTTAPLAKLEIQGTASASALIQQDTISCTLGLKSDGSGKITGCVSSDETLKTNIKNSNFDAISIIKKLQAVNYNWKVDVKSRDNLLHTGFIAQQVQKIFPSAVTQAGVGKDGKPLWGVDPNAINALLITGFNEQETQINSMTARVATLEKVLKIPPLGGNQEPITHGFIYNIFRWFIHLWNTKI